MQAIIVHYHLYTGGVKRVIESQIKGIKSVSQNTDMLLLCGDANELTFLHGIAVKPDPALNYSDPDEDEVRYAEKVSSIMSFITKSLSDHPILHFHNPNLGKNPALTTAVYNLASQGIPVINHCHDFPEDRIANLSRLESLIPRFTSLSLQQVMYPDFSWYHFIVLSSCDYDRIQKQGVSSSRIHLLPNPVLISEPFSSSNNQVLRRRICRTLGFNPAKKICTYPVRAIGRKNLGEFILIASLFDDVAHFAVTQPPRNPLEFPQYDYWKAFCRDNRLMVKFEAGESVNYEELINISDFCITTSLREGFGMVYLEPWLAGTPVIGRELSCIIDDLSKRGVVFPRLYKNILVETKEGLQDFKDIKQDEQANVIRSVIREHETRQKIIRHNPFLISLLDDMPPDIILKNQQVIKKRFSIEEYGKELLGIYREVSR